MVYKVRQLNQEETLPFHFQSLHAKKQCKIIIILSRKYSPLHKFKSTLFSIMIYLPNFNLNILDIKEKFPHLVIMYLSNKIWPCKVWLICTHMMLLLLNWCLKDIKGQMKSNLEKEKVKGRKFLTHTPAGTTPRGILIAVFQSFRWSSPFTTY